MLVIRRRHGEAVLIGDDIEIEILETSASHVKIGIRAPKAVAVLRKEIQMVGEQNRAASRSTSAHALERALAGLKRADSHNPEAER